MLRRSKAVCMSRTAYEKGRSVASIMHQSTHYYPRLLTELLISRAEYITRLAVGKSTLNNSMSELKI